MARMKWVPPAEVRRDLVKFGILYKNANYTDSYRND